LVIVNSSLELLFSLQAVRLHVHPTYCAPSPRKPSTVHHNLLYSPSGHLPHVSTNTESSGILRYRTKNRTLQIAIVLTTRSSCYGYRRRCGDCPWTVHSRWWDQL